LSEPFCDRSNIVTGKQFLFDVNQVAQRLPSNCNYVINLCDNRYLFLVSICAAIVCRKCNLLPPNKNTVTQTELHNRYNGSYILHDGCVELALGIEQTNLADFKWSNTPTEKVENSEIALEQIALISFTSGSTGVPKANLKTWRTLQQSSLINAQHMLPEQDQTFYHLATVPGQHMWGLETSVVMALFANVCLVDAQPLFPHDILKILSSMPLPRVLIATPLHLRALSLSLTEHEQSRPKIARILTATSPIDEALAAKIEQQFTTTIREVYGCSEVGSMAWRTPSKTSVWTHFTGLRFQQKAEQRVSVKLKLLANEDLYTK